MKRDLKINIELQFSPLALRDFVEIVSKNCFYTTESRPIKQNGRKAMARFVFLFIFLFLVSYAHGDIWAEKTLASLTLREKIGQLFMVDVRPQIEEEYGRLEKYFMIDVPAKTSKEYMSYVSKMVKEYHIGGLLCMRGKAIDQVRYINRFQHESRVPLINALDAEWGPAMRLVDVDPFPFNMTLGALPQKYEDDIYKLGKIIGNQCRQLGIHVNFAPVVDINNNSENPIINHRSFGKDKKNVARKGCEYMRGLHDAGVMAVAKHFPGHGNVVVDTHKDACELPFTKEELFQTEFYPFKYLIDKGVSGIMTAHLVTKAFDASKPATLSSIVMTDLLRKQLGFKGLIFADCMMMQSIHKFYTPGEAALLAFKAGVDIIVMSPDVPSAIADLEKAIKKDEALERRLNDSVLRILKTKEKCGLHKKRYVDEAIKLQTKQAKDLKKRLFAHAITLVRNVGNVVPCSKENKLLYVHVGDNENIQTPFYIHLKEWGTVFAKHLSWNAKESEIAQILSKFVDVDTVIIGLHDMSQRPADKFGVTKGIQDFLKILQRSEKKHVVTVFGNPYSLKFFENQSIVVAYQDDDEAQVAAADVIMGRAQAEGVLPV